MKLIYSLFALAGFLAIIGLFEILILDKLKIKGKSIIDWMFFFVGYAFK